jgi:hypothetical protein
MKNLNLPILLAIATAALLLYGCLLGPEREPCTGRLILENPIPDTTVAIGDTLFIDLATPPVFVSSEGRVSYSLNRIQGNTNIRVNLIDNPNDGNKNTLFLIAGINQGESIIELGANSGCLENSVTFNITTTEL